MTLPDRLTEGYHAFRTNSFLPRQQTWRDLARGQSPETMVIACADSRTDPSHLFATDPGELFVVRNVANLVPPCEADGSYHGTSAAVEYAVTSLKVRHIVVLGHGQCGGIAACLASRSAPVPGLFIGPWVGMADQAREHVLARHTDADEASLQRHLEHESVRRSLANLMTFPFVRAAVEAGMLTLHGAWFSIFDGQLHVLDPATDSFAVVGPAET